MGDRNVFFFVSGGVDSSVAFTLCPRALGADRVRGVYVDTGLMREGETEFVQPHPGNLTVEHAEEQFLTALAGVTDPEQKRHIIGEEFVRVQERIIESRRLLDEHWILGQGTIYPDTIESRRHGQGGADQDASQPRRRHSEADRSRPHRRAAEVVLQGRSARRSAAKWDCRASCSTAIRSPDRASPSAACARSSTRRCARRRRASSCRCIRWACRAIRALTRRCWRSMRWTTRRATELINRHRRRQSRDRAGGDEAAASASMQVRACSLTAERLARLRRADAIVRRLSHASGYDHEVWQFPVILIPLGSDRRARFGRAAAGGFGGRHDGAIGPDEGRPAERDHRGAAARGRHRRGVLRSDAQAAGHHRVGVDSVHSLASGGSTSPGDGIDPHLAIQPFRQWRDRSARSTPDCACSRW